MDTYDKNEFSVFSNTLAVFVDMCLRVRVLVIIGREGLRLHTDLSTKKFFRCARFNFSPILM